VIGCGMQAVKRGMCNRHYRSALEKGIISRKRAIGVTIQDRLNFHSQYIPETGCVEWTGTRHPETGYGSITINRKSVSTHRAAWEAANGSIKSRMHVLHKCDNRICVNPDHLFVGTNADNVADMDAKGRRISVKGEEKWNAKLNDELVRSIRKDCRTARQIADELGVGKTIIGLVKQHKIWRHVY